MQSLHPFLTHNWLFNYLVPYPSDSGFKSRLAKSNWFYRVHILSVALNLR